MIFRKKLRYILVESCSPVRMKEMQNSESLKSGMLSFLGQLPYFKANPQVIAQFNESVFVLSVNRGHERSAILALSFIKRLGETPVGFYTIRTSGTVRSLRAAFAKMYK